MRIQSVTLQSLGACGDRAAQGTGLVGSSNNFSFLRELVLLAQATILLAQGTILLAQGICSVGSLNYFWLREPALLDQRTDSNGSGNGFYWLRKRVLLA